MNASTKERTYSSLRLITSKEVVELNDILYRHGLSLQGGSLEEEDGVKKLYAVLERGSAATINEDRVGLVLMDYFKLDQVIIDGKRISRDVAEARVKRIDELKKNPPPLPPEWFEQRERERLAAEEAEKAAERRRKTKKAEEKKRSQSDKAWWL